VPQAKEAALAGPEGRAGNVPGEPRAHERRAARTHIATPGEPAFARRAREHESRVHKLLKGLSPAAQQSLHDPLGRLRTRLTARSAGVPAARRKGAR
jgi:hypothetical protein